MYIVIQCYLIVFAVADKIFFKALAKLVWVYNFRFKYISPFCTDSIWKCVSMTDCIIVKHLNRSNALYTTKSNLEILLKVEYLVLQGSREFT